MNLAQIRYLENEGTPAQWQLDPLQLGAVNLVAGRNATGKTRVLSTIKSLASLMLSPLPLENSNALWEAEWRNDNACRYLLRIREGRVLEEKLVVAAETRLERGVDGVGVIWAERLAAAIDFQIPDTLLALCAKQDALQHSFLRPLQDWARSVHVYPFNALGTANDAESLPEIFFHGSSQASFLERVKGDLQALGYPADEVGLTESTRRTLPGRTRPLELFIKEKRLKTITRQHAMSQGMLRSVALVICLNQLIVNRCQASVLVDDFGEGLDFEKSSALADILLDRCREGRFQLIMSTNERVVMNKLPLECWSVLEQGEGRTRVFNEANCKERFDNFKFTGLSNFDFFSMDFTEGQPHG